MGRENERAGVEGPRGERDLGTDAQEGKDGSRRCRDAGVGLGCQGALQRSDTWSVSVGDHVPIQSGKEAPLSGR